MVLTRDISPRGGVCKLIDLLLDRVTHYEKEESTWKAEEIRLTGERHQFEAMAETLANEKIEMETHLFGKFVAVLNRKKKKIRTLTSDIGAREQEDDRILHPKYSDEEESSDGGDKQIGADLDRSLAAATSTADDEIQAAPSRKGSTSQSKGSQAKNASSQASKRKEPSPAPASRRGSAASNSTRDSSAALAANSQSARPAAPAPTPSSLRPGAPANTPASQGSAAPAPLAHGDSRSRKRDLDEDDEEDLVDKRRSQPKSGGSGGGHSGGGGGRISGAGVNMTQPGDHIVPSQPKPTAAAAPPEPAGRLTRARSNDFAAVLGNPTQEAAGIPTIIRRKRQHPNDPPNAPVEPPAKRPPPTDVGRGGGGGPTSPTARRPGGSQGLSRQQARVVRHTDASKTADDYLEEMQ